jgi:hypothetical protein
MRFLISFVSCVLAATDAASAQPVPTTMPVPERSLGTYVRQTSTILPVLQITVQGRATLRVPADGVRIEAFVNGVSDNTDEAAIVARLRAGGLESPEVPSSSYFGNQNQQTIVRAFLRRPTPQRINALGKLAASILAEHPGLKLQNGNLTPFLDDCAGPESKVRRAAIDDARRRALEIAQASSVTLGQLTSVNDPSFGNGGGGAIEREPAVYFTMNESVSFSISR